MMKYFTPVCLFLILTVITQAQNFPREAFAFKIESDQITIDGKINDEAWKLVDFTSDFTQREPAEGQPSTQKTMVGFAYDENNLYVGARMYSDDPSLIYSQITRRDNTGNSERIWIALDTYLDRRTAYAFGITASGVRYDFYQPSDSHYSRDESYDPVWFAEVNRDSLGWTAEMRIPFSQLRFNEKEEQLWGLNIDRYMPALNEDAFWAPFSKSESGWSSIFGALRGIRDIKPSKRIELMPYISGNTNIIAEPDPADPFSKDMEYDYRAGGDVKIGLGPNLTLDATFNPDFGQIEADPAEVNLSAFESYFDEKRPFFTEGRQLLSSSGPEYFYSRRIGAAPSLNPRADYAEVKNNTPILGAAKLTGRLQSGASIGGLAAVTKRERTKIYDVETDRYHSVETEPLTAYGVARVQQEFGDEASTAGVILTGVKRDMNGSRELSALLPGEAVTGGADWNIRFNEGMYVLSGDAGFSYISGENEAITRLQKTSARYFQRPDADYVNVDTSRESLSGYRARFEFEKNEGEHWLWKVSSNVESPEFELNDIGILSSADEINSYAALTYRENTPGKFFYNYDFTFDGWLYKNFGGVTVHKGVSLDADFQFHNFWSVSLYGERNLEAMSPTLTRGGPLAGTPAGWEFDASVNTNYGKPTTGRIGAGMDTDDFGGWNWYVNGRLSMRIGNRLELNVSPSFSRRRDMRQYITSVNTTKEITYGRRYIFSAIDRSTLSMTVRVNYAFTPDLSLEIYAEPFASTGNYFSPGELSAPGSYKLNKYGEDGTGMTLTDDGKFTITDGGETFSFTARDFIVRSFRSNFVLRYEWLPGSTFYLVWQQNRYSSDRNGRTATPGEMFASIAESGDNYIAAKVTYWFSVN